MPSSASSGRTSSCEHPRLLGDQLPGPAQDRQVHLAGHHAAHRRDRDAGGDPALQPGDPDHVELVQVGGEDRQELGSLQQRHPLASLARSSTRLLKASQDSSRSRKRSDGSSGAGTGSKSSIDG